MKVHQEVKMRLPIKEMSWLTGTVLRSNTKILSSPVIQPTTTVAAQLSRYTAPQFSHQEVPLSKQRGLFHSVWRISQLSWGKAQHRWKQTPQRRSRGLMLSHYRKEFSTPVPLQEAS